MSTRRFHALVASSLLLAALASPGVVRAQPATPEARAAYESFRRGTGALAAGQPAEAVRALEESYRLRNSPIVLYPLALAHRELGHVRVAIENFERYLVEERSFPEGRDAAVRDALRELRARLAAVTLAVTPAHFRLRVDQRETPVDNGTVSLDPGEHSLEITAAGHAVWREQVRVAPGERLARAVTLTPEAAPTNAGVRAGPSSHATRYTASTPVTGRWWFWTGLGLLAAGGVTVGVLSASANAEPEPWAPGTTFNVVTIRVP